MIKSSQGRYTRQHLKINNSWTKFPTFTKMLVAFLWIIQIHQGKNHYRPQEAGFHKIYNCLSEYLQ